MSSLPVACKRCRAKKYKCTKVHPCERCIADGRVCVFPGVIRIEKKIEQRKQKREAAAADDGDDSDDEEGEVLGGGGGVDERERMDNSPSEDTANSKSSTPNDNNKKTKKKSLKNNNKRGGGGGASSFSTSTPTSQEEGGDGDQQNQYSQKALVIETRASKRRQQQQQQQQEIEHKPEEEQQQVVSFLSSTSKQFNWEVNLADLSTAESLMDTFCARALPHLITAVSLPSGTFFAEILKRPAHSLASSMHRDGALALACRACGQEAITKQLMQRMARTNTLMQHDSRTTILDTFVGLMLMFCLQGGEDTMGAFQTLHHLFAIHKALTRSETFDSVEAVCQCLDSMNLNDDPMHDGITEEEIRAQVRHTTHHLDYLCKTMDNYAFRMFISSAFELRCRFTTPNIRPAAVVITNLVLELQLLGLLTPGYLVEVYNRHDPHGKFGMSTIFSTPVPADLLPPPPTLAPSSAEVLLRRILVARRLVFASKISAEAAVSLLASLDCLKAVIRLRSGDRAGALAAARSAIAFTSGFDVNFWAMVISQDLVFLAMVFYELDDLEGMLKAISILKMIQRSTPAAAYVVAALSELRWKMAPNPSSSVSSSSSSSSLQQQQQQQQQRPFRFSFASTSNSSSSSSLLSMSAASSFSCSSPPPPVESPIDGRGGGGGGVLFESVETSSSAPLY